MGQIKPQNGFLWLFHHPDFLQIQSLVYFIYYTLSVSTVYGLQDN